MIHLIFKIALVLAIHEADNVTTIRIEHVGDSDKPIPSLCIGLSLATCRESGYEKGIMVDDDEIQTVEKFVREKKVSTDFNAQRTYETGSFRITILKNDTMDISYVLEGKKNSINYLTQLKNLSSNKKSRLPEELENIVKRIDH